MNHWNKKHYQPQKKPFTIDDIKKDINFSMFVCRLFYTNIAFDWVLINEDDITKSNISKYVQHLKELGLIRTLNYTKLHDDFTEILNEIMPNFNKYVDNKCPIVYQKTTTLHKNEQLIIDIRNKYDSNDWFNEKRIELENFYRTIKIKNEKLKIENNKDLTRIKKFANGVIAEVKTSKFWNIRLEFKRNKDVLLLNHELTEQEVKDKKQRKMEFDKLKTMTTEEKNDAYLKRCEGLKQ